METFFTTLMVWFTWNVIAPFGFIFIVFILLLLVVGLPDILLAINRLLFGSTRIGRVISINPTWGGAGNQWTTIDKERYATWWSRDLKIRSGDMVEYEPYIDRSMGRTMKAAKFIRKI